MMLNAGVSAGETSVAIAPDLEGFLTQAGTKEVHHSEDTLYAHLAGTYALLREWGQPNYVCVAGLLHSVYGTLTFTIDEMSSIERGRIVELVGTQSEALIHAFSTLSKRQLLGMARDGERASSPQATATDLIHIFVANLVEQAKLTRAGHDLFRPYLSDEANRSLDCRRLRTSPHQSSSHKGEAGHAD